MASADWQSKILKKEYQNWLAVGHALSLMLDGLRPYIEREMKAFHQALLANLATVPRCTCSTPTKHSCAWSAQLVRCHRGGKPSSPKWYQSDSSAWTDPHRGEWEVAKLFMSDLGTSKTTVVDANTTDCTGLINLMFWCVHFPIQRHVITAVRETRNTKWGHAPRQELTDSERADALTAIRDLLQDPELIADGDAKTALNEITLMEANFDAQSVERKVLADFQVAVLGQLGGIEGELRNVNRCCKKQQNNSNKIRKKLRGLENRQKKAIELLQSINDRIEDEERRNISFTSKTWKAIAWTLNKTKRGFVVNLCSLNTRSLLFWTFLIILLGCFKCLDHNSYNDGCPLEVGDVPFDTKEFNFTRYLNKSREHFTGRRWLYSELESILSDSQGNIVRGVVVIGKPGVGKSALSAQMICSGASSPSIHKRIIGYHLCKYSDKATQDPGRFVRNLVDLIARRIPEYGMLIYNSSFIPRVLQTSCLRDPYDCFEQAIAIPLSQVKNERQYYFIIIDALDECASDSAGTSLVQFVKDTYNRLPKWVRLVMTSRNDFAVLSHFNSFPKVHLSSSDARNLQDIEIFIASKLFEDTPFLERVKVMLGLGSDEVTYLTNKLLTQSEGNFLFAKLMLKYGKDDWHKQADLNKLPRTVGQQYERYLRRAYGSREKFKPALAILEILVATIEPLTEKQIFDVLRIQEKIDFEYEFFYALKGLAHFVTYAEDNTISLFHQTFREWLTNKDNLGTPYYVSRSRGHRSLVEYYINVLRNNSNSSIDIYRLVQHISFFEEGEHYLDDFRNIKANYVNATIDNDNRTLLHLSASESNRKALQILSEAFEDIDCEDSYGFTPAFVAAINGRAENVDYLLSKGANMEHRTKAPPSPGYVWGDPIVRSKTSFWNSTMMHAAASGGHNDIVRLLLTKNASFTKVNGVNLSAIQLAAENGHLEVVQVLHKHGAQLDHLSLQHAAFRGHAHVVAYLLKFGVEDTCMRCDGSFSWLQNRTRYQAANLDHSNNAILSDDKFKIFCQSALHLAVAKNHTEVAQLLLSQEYKAVHCIDFTGRTPLHEAVRQNHVEIAELVIMSGAKIYHNCSHFQNLSSVGDKHHLSFEERKVYSKDICHCGSTPFHLAARYGHVEVGTLLLRHGAKSDSMDCQGATPLHVAACHGHYSFIKWLISQRPSLHINTRSKNQSTLLHSAAICKNNQRVKPLIDMGASAYDTDEHGMTPLHYTVLNGFNNVDFLLLETSSWYDDLIFVWGSKGDFTFTHDSKHFLWGSRDDFTFAHDSKPITREVPLNFQCLKLLEIIESTDDSFINQVDENGTTALHLAAKNGEECCVIELLEKGARADVTDDKDRTPLDLSINSTPKEMDCRPYETECECSLEYDNNFDFHRAVNLRYHNSVANILLSKEAYSARKCDGTQTYLLHRAFEKEKPFIADTILSKGGLLRCKDKQGRTPLLIYLQNGGKWLDVVLKRFNVTIQIQCNKHFNVSEFHLVAFRKATALSENLLEQHKCDSHECYIEDGPLAKAIKNHPLGFRVIDECRDAEGYTALHRAAQGGNLLVLKKFISWGANPNLLTPQGYSALHLAIMSGIRPFSSFNARRTAEKAADVLLQATRHISAFDVGCNSAKMSLTVYHLSAYGGLTDFVNTLLNSRKDLGVDVNCSNVHGITPLYLAKLHVGTQETGQSKRDPWQEIVNLIEENGGRLTYPNRDVELNVLYKHLFGANLNTFVLDQSELPNNLFFKSLATQCRQPDLKHYGTGSMINPYQTKILYKIRQLKSSVDERQNRFQSVPRDLSQPYTTRETLVAVEKASWDLSRLLGNVWVLLERQKDGIIRRRNDTETSRNLYVNSQKLSLSDKETMKQVENQLREMHIRYESSKAIESHINRHLREILHEHSGVFGEEETSTIRKLLERSEERALCMDEIFQAKFMIMKFTHYIHNSRTEDLISLMQSLLYRTKFTSRRIPVEWLMPGTREESIPTWNLAVKFLYRLATQRDLTFDYLQVLSLGLDKDTRIPLSVDALYSLWLEN